MRIALDSRWMTRLLDLPESGMGYQRVRVLLRDGRTVGNAVALDARYLDVPDDAPAFAVSEIADIEVETAPG
jgi:hypothetical protein